MRMSISEVISVFGQEHNLKLSWADGMVGAVPIFETKEAAESYAKGYNVDVLPISEVES